MDVLWAWVEVPNAQEEIMVVKREWGLEVTLDLALEKAVLVGLEEVVVNWAVVALVEVLVVLAALDHEVDVVGDCRRNVSTLCRSSRARVLDQNDSMNSSCREVKDRNSGDSSFICCNYTRRPSVTFVHFCLTEHHKTTFQSFTVLCIYSLPL